ncbi:MAG: hypothetical protein ABEJ79_09515 [Halolamina sp.]
MTDSLTVREAFGTFQVRISVRISPDVVPTEILLCISGVIV